VFGGSQAVARITAALAASLARLLADWHVLHIAGDAGLPAAEATRAALPAPLAARYLPVAYLTDRMTDALVASDLVLGRAGSSTCAEVTAVGVASILVPYPYAGAHQRANAAYLAERGAARMISDEALDGERLLAEATTLRDDAARATLAADAADLGLPRAAETIAAELLAMGEGRPLPSLAGGAA
jgi:UDP-N-acetylglucosamine--N-acetylmuramyl-(pentapeptide) pyrophosphoryl-undecaprenol N-acetylglucosamine transferase